MNTSHYLTLASLVLIAGIWTDASAQETSPPKLVNAIPRTAEAVKTPTPRTLPRRNPPKDLLAQRWPAPSETLGVPAAVKTGTDDQKARFETAQRLMVARKPDLALPILLNLAKEAPERFEVQFTLGFCLAMVRRTDDATRAFQKAVSLDPKSADARLGLCRTLAEASKRIEAADECREAVRLAPTQAQFRRELAWLYMHNQQLTEAVTLLAASQDDLASMGMLGDSYFMSGEYYLAAGIYEKIALRWPTVGMAQFRLSQIYDYLDRPNDSIGAARQFAEMEPKITFSHINLGGKLQSFGFFDESIEAIKKALLLDPKSGEGAFLQSQTYTILGDTENALTNLRLAYKYLPPTVPLAYQLGRALIDNGAAAEAVEPLEFANKNDPNVPDIMRELGSAYLAVRRYDEGVELKERADQISPLPANFKMDLSYIKNRHQDIARFEEYRSAVERNPTDVNARMRLGRVYQFKDMLPEAERQFLEVVKLHPTDYRSHNQLAIFYADNGQAEKTIEPYRRAAELKPHHVLYGSLAFYLRKLGRLDEAIVAAKKAVELKGDSLEARLFLGESLLKKGLRTEALAEYQAALQVAPGDARPNFKLAWLYIKIGNKEGAFRHYGILRGLVPNEVRWLELCIRANFGTLP